jgi:hypothetical protein
MDSRTIGQVVDTGQIAITAKAVSRTHNDPCTAFGEIEKGEGT